MAEVKVTGGKVVQKLGTSMLKGKSGKKYSGVGGVAIDRTNKVCFVIAETADKSCAALFSASMAKVQKGSASWSCLGEWKGTGKSATAAGHPNDICCKPSGANTYVYIACCRVGKGILRVLVNNAKKTIVKRKTFLLYDGEEKACGAIGYSTGADKHIIKSTGTSGNHEAVCYVGNFKSDGTFGWTRKIFLRIGTEVQVPGHGAMNLLQWSGQGMAFYKGYVYLTMSSVPKEGYFDKTKYKSVMIAYHVGDLGSVQDGMTFEPERYLFDKITFNSKASDKFEFEGVDCYSDKAFVADNEARTGGGDCIRVYVL